MGWCHEFGVTVREGCGHPMAAGEAACECPRCGIVCEGQFKGCATVWAAGPRAVVLVRPEARADEQVLAPASASSDLARSVQTAWPLTDAQEGIWLKVSPPPADEQVGTVAEQVQTVVEVPAAEAAPVGPATKGARGQIFEWLQDSFEGLNSQLRVLSDNLSRQQQALAEMSDSHAAAGRLSELADALPERIGAAVQEAVTAGRRSLAAEAEQVAELGEGVGLGKGSGTAPGPEPELTPLAVTAEEHWPPPERDWISAVEEVMIDLRHPTGPERGDSGERPPEPQRPAAAPLGEPTASELVDARGGAPSAAPDVESGSGLRTQLNSLASTVQTRLNRSGWQEKLRSLSTR